MESFFASFSNASPITGTAANDNNGNDDAPPPSYPQNDPLSVLASIRRAKAVAAETNAECDPAPPPSPARSARSARSAWSGRSGKSAKSAKSKDSKHTHYTSYSMDCVEVDIDTGPTYFYSGGPGVAEFLAAREEAENGGGGGWRVKRKGSKKWGGGALKLSPPRVPRTTKAAGKTNILDDEGGLAPPPPQNDDDDDNTEEEEEGKSNTKRRRMCMVIAALLVVLIGVAVAVGLVLGGQNNSNGSSSSAMAGGSTVPDDFDNVGIPDEFDNGSSGNGFADDFGNTPQQEQEQDNVMMEVPAPPTLRPPSAAPPTPRPPPTPCASNTYDAGYGCLGRCEAGQKCGEYGFFDAFYPNDSRPCPSMCCRNGRVELGGQDMWYQCCEGVAGNLADYQRPGSNVRRSCSPLF